MKKNNLKTKKFGPALSKKSSNVFVSIGDEALMFKAADQLSNYQQKHIASMRRGISSFAMAQILSSKKNDVFVLDSEFKKKSAFFKWHLKTWDLLGVSRSNNFFFAPYEKMYAAARRLATKNSFISTICFSVETQKFFGQPELLKISQTANSKIKLHQNDKKFGYQTPKTTVFSGPERMLKRSSHRFPAIVKWDGLGGGENVKYVKDKKSLKEICALILPDEQCLLQELISFDKWSEYNTDYVVGSKDVKVLNHRFKLTRGTGWIGNVYARDFKLSKVAQRNLDRCARWLHKEGFFSKEGYFSGLQYFYNHKKSLIFEINARWGGGTPVAILLDKMKYPPDTVVVSHIESIPENKIPAYQTAVTENLWNLKTEVSPFGTEFKVFPVSFSPYIEKSRVSIWLLVVGNYENYLKHFSRAVGVQLENSNLVSKILRDQKVNETLLRL